LQNKGLAITWSEGDSESESEGESAKHVTALTSVCVSEDDTSADELTFDELAAAYKKLCTTSAEVRAQGEKQKKLIKELEDERQKQLSAIEGLNDEIALLTSKLNQMTKSIRMMNKGTDTLEEILKVGQQSGTKSGLGFGKRAEHKRPKARVQKFKQMSKPMSQHRGARMNDHQKRIFQNLRCHHCGRLGHIKAFCYWIHGFPNRASHVRPKHKTRK
jgi:chromosome segregation ATPase